MFSKRQVSNYDGIWKLGKYDRQFRTICVFWVFNLDSGFSRPCSFGGLSLETDQ